MLEARSFCTARISRSELMIKEWNFEAMYQVRSCSSIASILRRKRIGNSKSNFSGFSKYSNQLGSNYTSCNYQRSGKSIMYSICHYYNRALQRGGREKSLQKCQSLSQVMTRSTRWKLSKTMQSMLNKQMDTYQGYIIWLHERVTWKKRIPENFSWQSYTSERWSSPSTKTIWRSQ